MENFYESEGQEQSVFGLSFGIIWDHFHEAQINLNFKNMVEGLSDQCTSQVNESLPFSQSPDEITSMIKQTYTLYCCFFIFYRHYLHSLSLLKTYSTYSTLQILVPMDHCPHLRLPLGCSHSRLPLCCTQVTPTIGCPYSRLLSGCPQFFPTLMA